MNYKKKTDQGKEEENMSNIVLARIDDRLIHGQVMTAWVQYTGGNEIVIADDKVANDPFLSAVITRAVWKKPLFRRQDII